MTPPPLPLMLAYRLFGWRLGPDYQEWTYDDITRRGYTFRQSLPVGLALGVLIALVFTITGAHPARAIIPLIGVLVLSYFLRKTLAERALRQQGLSATGEVDADWFTDDDERRRRNLAGAATTAILVVAGLTILAVKRD